MDTEKNRHIYKVSAEFHVLLRYPCGSVAALYTEACGKILFC